MKQDTMTDIAVWEYDGLVSLFSHTHTLPLNCQRFQGLQKSARQMGPSLFTSHLRDWGGGETSTICISQCRFSNAGKMKLGIHAVVQHGFLILLPFSTLQSKNQVLCLQLQGQSRTCALCFPFKKKLYLTLLRRREGQQGFAHGEEKELQVPEESMVETDQLSVVCTSDGSLSITKSQTNEDQSAGVCIFLLCCCLPLYKFNRSYFVLVASKLWCVSCQSLVLGYVCSLSRKTRLRAWPTKGFSSRLLVYLIQSGAHTPPAPTVGNGVAKKKKRYSNYMFRNW